MCTGDSGSPPNNIPFPLPHTHCRQCPTPPCSDQASPFHSCCPIICRHGERHRLPHHAGERPTAGGRGGLSPAVRGAQPDPDLLLGISEGRHTSSQHWGEGQPVTAPTTRLAPAAVFFSSPRGIHPPRGQTVGNLCPYLRAATGHPHPLPGRMQPPPSPKAATSLPALM